VQGLSEVDADQLMILDFISALNTLVKHLPTCEQVGPRFFGEMELQSRRGLLCDTDHSRMQVQSAWGRGEVSNEVTEIIPFPSFPLQRHSTQGITSHILNYIGLERFSSD
jgi:hypothetical protein